MRRIDGESSTVSINLAIDAYSMEHGVANSRSIFAQIPPRGLERFHIIGTSLLFSVKSGANVGPGAPVPAWCAQRRLNTVSLLWVSELYDTLNVTRDIYDPRHVDDAPE